MLREAVHRTRQCVRLSRLSIQVGGIQLSPINPVSVSHMSVHHSRPMCTLPAVHEGHQAGYLKKIALSAREQASKWLGLVVAGVGSPILVYYWTTSEDNRKRWNARDTAYQEMCMLFQRAQDLRSAMRDKYVEGNAMQALDLGISGIRACESLLRILNLQDEAHREASAAIEQVHGFDRNIVERIRANLRYHVGSIYLFRGEYEKAGTILREALVDLEQLKRSNEPVEDENRMVRNIDTVEWPRALIRLADSQGMYGSPYRALSMYKQTLTDGSEWTPPMRARADNNLAILLYGLGRDSVAIDEMAKIPDTLKDLVERLKTLSNARQSSTTDEAITSLNNLAKNWAADVMCLWKPPQTEKPSRLFRVQQKFYSWFPRVVYFCVSDDTHQRLWVTKLDVKLSPTHSEDAIRVETTERWKCATRKLITAECNCLMFRTLQLPGVDVGGIVDSLSSMVKAYYVKQHQENDHLWFISAGRPRILSAIGNAFSEVYHSDVSMDDRSRDALKNLLNAIMAALEEEANGTSPNQVRHLGEVCLTLGMHSMRQGDDSHAKAWLSRAVSLLRFARTTSRQKNVGIMPPFESRLMCTAIGLLRQLNQDESQQQRKYYDDLIAAARNVFVEDANFILFAKGQTSRTVRSATTHKLPNEVVKSCQDIIDILAGIKQKEEAK